MKIKYLSTLIAASIVSFTAVVAPTQFIPAQANPCAAGVVNPCAANPCAATPCAGVVNPCAANPCAADPCAADPCAAAVASSIPTVFSDPQAEDNLAIRGYDPVAYFTVGAPVEGSGDYAYEWNGATWRFSSAANKELFASNPEAYTPQYGGYCAKALSEGNLASTVPEAWDIVEGKLYLNYSLDVQTQWKGDIPGNISKADSKWPSILETSNVVYYDTVGAVYF